METFNLDRETARLIIFQRIQFLTTFGQKIRKLFGRYIFTNFYSKYLINSKVIGKRYFDEMKSEYENLSKYISFNDKKILSIGGGMCGLELIINFYSKNNFFSIIEKNYVSKKIKYGWDENNDEAYNNIDLLNKFLQKNGMKKNQFQIHDFDKYDYPLNNFDYVISLYSLDYHYDFNLYLAYFKKIVKKETVFIFDTIRPDYFNKLFESVKIIGLENKKIHSSKRILCKNFLRN